MASSAVSYRPAIPDNPQTDGLSLAEKIEQSGMGQRVEYRDYDVGFSPYDNRYYVNWEYGTYGMKKNQRRFDTIEELESFLRGQGLDVEKFGIKWDACMFNGL